MSFIELGEDVKELDKFQTDQLGRMIRQSRNDSYRPKNNNNGKNQNARYLSIEKEDARSSIPN